MGIAKLRQKLEAARDTAEYRLEDILSGVAEQVSQLLASQGVTRSEFAQRLEVSPAYITKLLNGNPNLTIKSLDRLADALGQRLDIHFMPKITVAQSVTTSLAPGRVQFIPDTVTQRPAQGVTEQTNEVSDDLPLAA